MEYQVIVEQKNGSWRAVIPALSDLSAEAPSCDEALQQAQQAASNYLSQVKVATIEVAERPAEFLAEEEERARLIADLEQLEPQTELGVKLKTLRLKMLRAGQRLRSLDEINRELGREEYVDVH